MSKRKRATGGKGAAGSNGDESTDEVKPDMVHVTPDLLAGSPDIFAGRKTASPEPALGVQMTATSPPTGGGVGVQMPAVESQPLQPTEASTTLATERAQGAAAEPAQTTPQPPPGPTAPPPPFVNAVAYQPARKRGRSASALGIVFVVVGIFALAVVLSGVDLTQYGWPLFILIPGLTLMVIGFASVGAAATVPGGVLTMLGLVLAYTSSTGDWPLWAYGWSLVIPGGIGLGMYLQALRDHDSRELQSGRMLVFVSVLIFLIGFVLFESILGISGREYFGAVGKAALPVLLIVVGAILLVRSLQRSRQR